jgi:hypothetical protein
MATDGVQSSSPRGQVPPSAYPDIDLATRIPGIDVARLEPIDWIDSIDALFADH